MQLLSVYHPKYERNEHLTHKRMEMGIFCLSLLFLPNTTLTIILVDLTALKLSSTFWTCSKWLGIFPSPPNCCLLLHAGIHHWWRYGDVRGMDEGNAQTSSTKFVRSSWLWNKLVVGEFWASLIDVYTTLFAAALNTFTVLVSRIWAMKETINQMIFFLLLFYLENNVSITFTSIDCAACTFQLTHLFINKWQMMWNDLIMTKK